MKKNVIIQVGCFAVLWPKIFYPMLFGGGGTPADNAIYDEG